MDKKTKIILIIPPVMIRAVMLSCWKKSKSLTDLCLIPILASSLINAVAGVRFYNSPALKSGLLDQENLAMPLEVDLGQLFLTHDWVIFVSSILSIYFYLHFIKAVLRFEITGERQTLKDYFAPQLSMFKFYLAFFMVMLLSLLPGSIIVSILLGFNMAGGGFLLSVVLFIAFTIFAFARISPTLASAAIDTWLSPIDSFAFSNIKGWTHSIFMMIVFVGVTALIGYGLISSLALSLAQNVGQETVFTSYNFHLALSLAGNIISYGATIPLMVMIGMLYRGVKSGASPKINL